MDFSVLQIKFEENKIKSSSILSIVGSFGICSLK